MKLRNNKYILSISGGNILTSLGGTEKVIVAHRKMFNKMGISYVYIYPVYKNILNFELYFYWGLVIDGEYYGLLSTNELLSFLGKNTDFLVLKIHIHHLRNIKLSELERILNHLLYVDIFFYLHDFYILCDEYTLRKSSGIFCGEGIPSMEKCSGCDVFRCKQNSDNRRLFLLKYLSRTTLIAPSECPAEIVRNSIPELKKRIRVVYHQKLVGEYKGNSTLIKDEKLKIAFCGLPIDIKGWDEFVNAAGVALENKSEIELYHLGKKSEVNLPIQNYQVGFQDGCKNMTEMLRELGIDCVVLWSKRPETYSYVYFECLAANVFILANINGGNIAKQVQLRHNGMVLNSEDELSDTLSNSNKLKEHINNYKKSKNYGPLELFENEEIVQLSTCKGTRVDDFKSYGISIKKTIIQRLYNRLLLQKCSKY